MAAPTQAIHLVKRFFGSLSTRPVAPDDDLWARDHLGIGEITLWDAMSLPDRRHSVGVAREVARRLGARATRPVIAAALLHDVGKVDSGFGTLTRVGATVAGAVADRVPQGRRRVPGRLGSYLRHDEVGARLLEGVGADPLTVAWAREHHRPEAAWTVPVDIGRVLKDVDDD